MNILEVNILETNILEANISPLKYYTTVSFPWQAGADLGICTLGHTLAEVSGSRAAGRMLRRVSVFRLDSLFHSLV